jgi:hypothetical protein
MHGLEKSDCCVVALKWANKDAQAEAEFMERRRQAEGNAGQWRTCRTQSRGSVSPQLARVRERATALRLSRHYPRWEPGA